MNFPEKYITKPTLEKKSNFLVGVQDQTKFYLIGIITNQVFDGLIDILKS